MGKKQIPPAALEKLKESGLTLEDAKLLGIEFLTSEDVARTGFLKIGNTPPQAIKINYYSPSGDALSDCPGAAPFYRLRLLPQKAEVKGFSSVAKKKTTRYLQPPNTLPVAYYPKNIDWEPIINNPDEPIILTEGELKAAKASKEGFPTIGLGGVNSWRALSKGVLWLESLTLVNWVSRNVYVIFDSDITINKDVQAALESLLEALNDRGAICWVAFLPSNGGKVGLDDFLNQEGVDGKKALKKLLGEAQNFGLSKPLLELNKKYICVTKLGCVVCKDEPSVKFNAQNFKTFVAADKLLIPVGVGGDDGLKTKYKTVSLGFEWLQWPLRARVDKLVYRPGSTGYVELEGGQTGFNLWSGWGAVPKKGEVKPFLDLVEHVFKGAEPEHMDWFLKWCAYPIQNPGTKMYTACIIHGLKHGTGKSLIGEILVALYGANASQITPADFFKPRNPWAVCKQFIFIEESDASNKRAINSFLKRIITQKSVWVDQKWVAEHEIEDFMNYLFTSNPPDTFYIEDDDRRFFIHEVLVTPLKRDFYEGVRAWRDAGGLDNLLHYFLNLDLTGFSPRDPAPRTAARKKMIQLGYTDLEEWVRDLLDDPGQILGNSHLQNVEKMDFYSAKDLHQVFDPDGRFHNESPVTVGKALAAAGSFQVLNGVRFNVGDGARQRFWVVRNFEKWSKASLTQCEKHLGLVAVDKSKRKY